MMGRFLKSISATQLFYKSKIKTVVNLSKCNFSHSGLSMQVVDKAFSFKAKN